MTIHKVQAVNTAPDSENRIHSLETAVQYGFRDGLVPGVTIYGYMCQPVLQHFGLPWLQSGSAKLRLLKPYFDGEWVEVQAVQSAGQMHVETTGPRAILDASMASLLNLPETIPEWRKVNKVPANEASLGKDTLLGSFDALDLSTPQSILEAANLAFMANYALEPWIHTGSIVQHFHSVNAASVRGIIANEYERKGHRLVDIDYCYVEAGGNVSARVLHTAIWKLKR